MQEGVRMLSESSQRYLYYLLFEIVNFNEKAESYQFDSGFGDLATCYASTISVSANKIFETRIIG